MQLALPEGNKIPSLNSIHKYFQGQNILLQKHNYCGFCIWYIGIETKTKCDKCGKSDIQFFVDLPMEEDGELYEQHFSKHITIVNLVMKAVAILPAQAQQPLSGFFRLHINSDLY